MVREVREIIPEDGSLRIGQILPRLRPETVRGAAHHSEDMTADTLRKKLVERSKRGKYVTKKDGGLWGRGPIPA